MVDVAGRRRPGKEEQELTEKAQCPEGRVFIAADLVRGIFPPPLMRGLLSLLLGPGTLGLTCSQVRM